MNKRNELKGMRFGRLTVIEEAGRAADRHILWRCVCDCGKETVVSSRELKSGHTKSCGCYRAEALKKARRTHGWSDKERLYEIWLAMRKRCNNPNSPDYKWYGTQGVTVCEEWNDYGKFREWAIANGYNPDAKYGECTIDRINPFGNYEPSNCRWVSFAVQSRNKRANYKGDRTNG